MKMVYKLWLLSRDFHFISVRHPIGIWNQSFLSCESLLSVCRAPATEPKKVEKKSFFPPWQSLNEEKMLTATIDEIGEESGLWDSTGRCLALQFQEKIGSIYYQKKCGSCFPLTLGGVCENSGQGCSQTMEANRSASTGEWSMASSCYLDNADTAT